MTKTPTKTAKLFLMSACAIVALMSTPVQAADISQSDIETIVSDYIKANPEIILESLENYRITQQKRDKQATVEKIKESMNILASDDSPMIGNKDGDVTVIEFFDYNCGYCKRAVPDIQNLVEKDDNVRVIFKEMPILSPGSTLAAKWALAAHEQGKYFEYHSALMNFRGEKSVASLTKIAKELDLDVKKISEDAESDKIKNKLDADLKIAREIGVQGTPAFIVNGKFFPGYMGPSGLDDAIKTARKK